MFTQWLRVCNLDSEFPNAISTINSLGDLRQATFIFSPLPPCVIWRLKNTGLHYRVVVRIMNLLYGESALRRKSVSELLGAIILLPLPVSTVLGRKGAHSDWVSEDENGLRDLQGQNQCPPGTSGWLAERERPGICMSGQEYPAWRKSLFRIDRLPKQGRETRDFRILGLENNCNSYSKSASNKYCRFAILSVFYHTFFCSYTLYYF